MLTLTEAASRKLEQVLAQQAEHGRTFLGLRLSATGGCCSGPRYGLALAEATAAGDWVGEYGGVKVLVDPASAPLLSGIRIDYIETEQGAGFTIENPNASPPAETSGCGCGHGHGAAGSGCGCGGH